MQLAIKKNISDLSPEEVDTERVKELCHRLKMNPCDMPLGRVSIKSKPLPSAVFEEVVNLIVAERNTTQLLSLRKFDGRLNVSESQEGIWKCYTPVAM